MSQAERCDLCRWWVKFSDADYGRKPECLHADDHEGFCHRFPPVLDTFLVEEDSQELGADAGASFRVMPWVFPVTLAAAFCGEFARAGQSASKKRGRKAARAAERGK